MIKEIEDKIKKANLSYRVGKPIISDSEYDTLIDELTVLDPDNELLNKVGFIIPNDSRKTLLPIKMASMNKVKTMILINDWVRLKNIPKNTQFVLTPKFDGISLTVNELSKEALTRGDGVYGQKSDTHYNLIQNKLTGDPFYNFTYGEVMIPKKVFQDKYSNDFSNPRNLVGGLLNSKDISPILKDCVYIKYGATNGNNTSNTGFKTKSEILEYLNRNQDIKVSFKIVTIDQITEDYMVGLFNDWSEDFEIDGIIIEVNSLDLQNKLGRETSSENPVWARAYKSPSFEETVETEVIGMTWTISKYGLLKPVLHVKPIKTQGVIISNVTGNNARFVKDMGLGIGSVVKIKRSGMVIPLIVEVVKKVPFVMPGGNIKWNDNGVELVTNTETSEQKFKKIVSFFEILEVENCGEGVLAQLWNAGYQNLIDILNIKSSDMEKLEGFGKKKSKLVFDNIQSKLKGVELCKLQHASGLFEGLGSKKLVLLEKFDTKPSFNDVMSIEGFAETSTKTYLDNYDKFYEFIKELPITIKKKEVIMKTGNDLDGKVYVFTGVRDEEAQTKIESLGGKIGSGVSKNTTTLVMKAKGSGSSKETKAIEMGLEILTLEELREKLGL
jgi:DNA ligase (NAD+)